MPAPPISRPNPVTGASDANGATRVSERSPGRYGPRLVIEQLEADLHAAKAEASEARAAALVLEQRVAELTAQVSQMRAEIGKLKARSDSGAGTRNGPPLLPNAGPTARWSDSIDVSDIAELIVERTMSGQLNVADIASLIRDTLDRPSK